MSMNTLPREAPRRTVMRGQVYGYVAHSFGVSTRLLSLKDGHAHEQLLCVECAQKHMLDRLLRKGLPTFTLHCCIFGCTSQWLPLTRTLITSMWAVTAVPMSC